MIIEAEEDETFWELSGSHLCEERKSWDMGSAFVHNMPRKLSLLSRNTFPESGSAHHSHYGPS